MSSLKGRDFSLPYTPSEIVELRKVFKGLSCYEPGRIPADGIRELVEAIGYERTEEQILAYIKYWNEKCDGKVTEDQFIDSVTTLHDTSAYALDYAKKADKDNKGYIDSGAFLDIVRLIEVHDPSIGCTKDFQEFVKQGDQDRDGKVSVGECAVWIGKQIDAAKAKAN